VTSIEAVATISGSSSSSLCTSTGTHTLRKQPLLLLLQPVQVAGIGSTQPLCMPMLLLLLLVGMWVCCCCQGLIHVHCFGCKG
jgi:hypothetical protein